MIGRGGDQSLDGLYQGSGDASTYDGHQNRKMSMK